MAGHKLTGPEQSKAMELYRNCGNISEVAKVMDCDWKTIARLLVRMGVVKSNAPGPMPAQMVADKVVEKIGNLPDVKRLAFEGLLQKYGSKEVMGILKNPERYDTAVKEQAKLLLLTILNEMFERDKLKGASLAALAQTVPIMCDVAMGKYRFIEDKKHRFNKGEIIEQLNVSIKKVMSFDPVMAKEIKATLEAVANTDPALIKKAVKERKVIDVTPEVKDEKIKQESIE